MKCVIGISVRNDQAIDAIQKPIFNKIVSDESKDAFVDYLKNGT